MTFRDPYQDPMRDRDPYAVDDREPYIVRIRNEGWSAGSMISALIALALVGAATIYAINRSSVIAPSVPSSTGTSAPSSTGQDGGVAPMGTVR